MFALILHLNLGTILVLKVYIYNPAKMAKEKSTMMRLPHWIVRRTLACLRCLLEHPVFSNYFWCLWLEHSVFFRLILMLFREKKKLQDELNQLSRNCLKDVESRSTVSLWEYVLIIVWHQDNVSLSQQTLDICLLGILHLYEMVSLLVHNHLTFKIPRSTQSSMLSTVQLCNYIFSLTSYMIYFQAKPDKLRKGGQADRKQGWGIFNRE